jgi:hypothetical protein
MSPRGHPTNKHPSPPAPARRKAPGLSNFSLLPRGEGRGGGRAYRSRWLSEPCSSPSSAASARISRAGEVAADPLYAVTARPSWAVMPKACCSHRRSSNRPAVKHQAFPTSPSPRVGRAGVGGGRAYRSRSLSDPSSSPSSAASARVREPAGCRPTPFMPSLRGPLGPSCRRRADCTGSPGASDRSKSSLDGFGKH